MPKRSSSATAFGSGTASPARSRSASTMRFCAVVPHTTTADPSAATRAARNTRQRAPRANAANAPARHHGSAYQAGHPPGATHRIGPRIAAAPARTMGAMGHRPCRSASALRAATNAPTSTAAAPSASAICHPTQSVSGTAAPGGVMPPATYATANGAPILASSAMAAASHRGRSRHRLRAAASAASSAMALVAPSAPTLAVYGPPTGEKKYVGSTSRLVLENALSGTIASAASGTANATRRRASAERRGRHSATRNPTSATANASAPLFCARSVSAFRRFFELGRDRTDHHQRNACRLE